MLEGNPPMRARRVGINGAPFDPHAPFGGIRKSGLDREGGRYGIDELLEPHSIQIPQ